MPFWRFVAHDGGRGKRQSHQIAPFFYKSKLFKSVLATHTYPLRLLESIWMLNMWMEWLILILPYMVEKDG